MTSERITIDMTDDEQMSLIAGYVRDHMSEATNELIDEEYGDITIDNFHNVATAAMINEMIINILSQQIEEATQPTNKEED